MVACLPAVQPPRVQNFVTRMLKKCTMFLRSVQPSTESLIVRNSLRTAGPMSNSLCISTVQTALGVAVRWLEVTDFSTRGGSQSLEAKTNYGKEGDTYLGTPFCEVRNAREESSPSTFL
ncbi:hypothetical protein D6C77_03919 [Aureobasidium pullulans]|nr:hypothetical protein D6C77_03919 [Aureobasidium pullulans]